MKKQILFLAMFTMALIFAGTNSVFGQATDVGASTTAVPPLSCVSTGTSLPLHPYAGVPYIYRLDGTGTTDNAAETYTWWVTKDPDFITAFGTMNTSTALSSPAITTSAFYGVATDLSTEPTADQVTITWSANILASTEYHGDVTAAGTPADPSPTFVVGYATGEKCADNIQVFEINPLPSFVVDIAPIDPSDNATTLDWDDLNNTAETCVDNVQTATYDNTLKELTMDYGTNTIYFEVAAANFVTDWTPSFYIAGGLLTSQTAVLSMYETLADATGTGTAIATSGDLTVADMSTTPGTFSWAPGEQITATSADDVSSGVSVFIKVVISNNQEESLVDNPFILAVDARDETNTGIWDMEDDDCTTVTDEADQVDLATITITPRPTLQMDGTLMNESNSVVPDDVITKTP